MATPAGHQLGVQDELLGQVVGVDQVDERELGELGLGVAEHLLARAVGLVGMTLGVDAGNPDRGVFEDRLEPSVATRQPRGLLRTVPHNRSCSPLQSGN